MNAILDRPRILQRILVVFHTEKMYLVDGETNLRVTRPAPHGSPFPSELERIRRQLGLPDKLSYSRRSLNWVREWTRRGIPRAAAACLPASVYVWFGLNERLVVRKTRRSVPDVYEHRRCGYKRYLRQDKKVERDIDMLLSFNASPSTSIV
ncbi:hypothetical protein B0H11DRAFT_1280071 [Mycena galericulata]|nr:hypothetical protein B0H11DRAFT_1280071 [Mycena galericulata]